MNRDTFWKIIDDAHEKVGNVYHVASSVTKMLQELSADEIVSFKQNQHDLMIESYHRDLWAVGFIMNGGCSDDGFEYFRAWLMANGGERWKAAMKKPESIGDWAEPEKIVYEYEDMLYVAVNAYKIKTGEDFPYDRLTGNYPKEPAGEWWEEDQLETIYPELSKKFHKKLDDKTYQTLHQILQKLKGEQDLRGCDK